MNQHRYSDVDEEKLQEKDLKKGWVGFTIPFVIRISDDLLSSPSSAPDVSKLAIEPAFDSQTGEEIGESPTVCIHLDKGETKNFSTCTREAETLLSGLEVEQNGWLFVENALGYFIKAFFTDGVEQLLWHIATLEALLGEKGEGVTERLARRVTYILRATKGERKRIRKQFKELYNFRSDLVHGNSFKSKVYIGHLRQARNFAKQTLLWFLHYLAYIQANLPQDTQIEKIPNRDDLLLLLDLDQNRRARIGPFVNILPPQFPCVSKWAEQHGGKG